MKNQYFLLGDLATLSEREQIGITGKNTFTAGKYLKSNGINIRAKVTGEYREPRKGEWYISGARPQAYKAPNDLNTKFMVAVLVKVDIKTKTIITEVK